MYVYSLHSVQRVYIHTYYRREEGNRTPRSHHAGPSHHAPLKESGGRSDVSDPKRTFRLHPERRPPYGQTSINQILLFVLPLVVGFLYGSVDGLCLCPVDRLPLHTGQLDDYFDDVIHGYLFRLVSIQSLRPMWLGSLRTHSRALSGRIRCGCSPPLVSRGRFLVRHTCGTCRNRS